MNIRCVTCGIPFKDNELIKVTVTTKFKLIPSRVAFALCKPIDYEQESLIHLECPNE
jgi:hypothetical protein